MNFDYGTVAATAVVQSVAVYVFHRFFDKRDERIETLETKLDAVEKEKIKNIEQQLSDGKSGRNNLHKRVDDLDIKIVKQEVVIRNLEINSAKWENSLLKLERIGEKVDSTTERMEEISAQQQITSRELAATTAILKERKHDHP